MMQHFGFLRKKNNTSSPRKNAAPKSALRVIAPIERSGFGQVNNALSTNYVDAFQGDAFCRGKSGIHSNQNSPKPEQFTARASEYGEVFGATPDYEISRPSSVCDETYRMSPRSSPRWKDSDFPVFGSPVQNYEAVGAVSGKGNILDDRRRLYSSGLQNNLFAIGIKSKVSSRSNSCAQSPLRTASSSFNDRTRNDFLTASVRLRPDPTDVAQPFGGTEKVGGMSGTKTLETDSRGSLFRPNENFATLTLGTSSESQNFGSTTSRYRPHNPSRTKDEPNIDPSSLIVLREDGITSTYSSEDSKVKNENMKKLPTVSPSPSHSASSPRLKNQRLFLRRKYRMEPTEDLCVQANYNAQTSKELASSPSSSFQRSSRAVPGSFARTIAEEKPQKQAPEELVSDTSRHHLKVLDEGVVSNRAGKQTKKDFDIFASAVAAIKNAESKFKLANTAKQKENQKFVTHEEALERQAESGEHFCNNKETEDTIDKLGSSSKVEDTKESFRKPKNLAEEIQELEIRSYHEVLEREETEALEAVEKERKHREKERQKQGKLQGTRASAEIQEAEEQAVAEIWEGFKRVAAQQMKRGMAEQNEMPLARSNSIADQSAGGNELAGTIATENVVTVEKTETETLQKLEQNISFARVCIDSEKTTEQIHQPTDQPDINQTPCKLNLMDKLGENNTPINDAECVSVEEVADDWLLTPNLEEEKEDDAKGKATSIEFTLNSVVKALNEKNQQNFEVQQEQAEKHRLAELLDGDIKRWASGKEQNLRALLSTLQYVLWPECGWQPVYLTDIISPTSMKKVYRKAMLFVHPDKMQQKSASVQQKYIAEKIFDLLKNAWSRFNHEETF